MFFYGLGLGLAADLDAVSPSLACIDDGFCAAVGCLVCQWHVVLSKSVGDLNGVGLSLVSNGFWSRENRLPYISAKSLRENSAAEGFWEADRLVVALCVLFITLRLRNDGVHARLLLPLVQFVCADIVLWWRSRSSGCRINTTNDGKVFGALLAAMTGFSTVPAPFETIIDGWRLSAPCWSCCS